MSCIRVSALKCVGSRDIVRPSLWRTAILPPYAKRHGRLHDRQQLRYVRHQYAHRFPPLAVRYRVTLAFRLAPSDVPGLHSTTSIIIAVIFVALLIQIIHEMSSLEVVDIYTTLLLTFGYYILLVPLYIWRLLIFGNLP